jgi:hypothetical protein
MCICIYFICMYTYGYICIYHMYTYTYIYTWNESNRIVAFHWSVLGLVLSACTGGLWFNMACMHVCMYVVSHISNNLWVNVYARMYVVVNVDNQPNTDSRSN